MISKNYKRDEILQSPEYGSLLKKEDVLFHGINNSVWKIESIFKLGILSKRAAEKQHLSLGFNYGITTKNGFINGFNNNHFISCANSPVHPDSVGYENGAFGVYIKDGISFALEKVVSIPNYRLKKSFNSGIPGEELAAKQIEPEKIIGLLISETLLTKKMSEINFLQGGSISSLHIRCQSLLKFLEQFDIKDENLAANVKKEISISGRKQIEDRCNTLFLSYVRKTYGSDKITLADYISVITPERIKIFNSKGFEIPRHRSKL